MKTKAEPVSPLAILENHEPPPEELPLFAEGTYFLRNESNAYLSALKIKG